MQHLFFYSCLFFYLLTYFKHLHTYIYSRAFSIHWHVMLPYVSIYVSEESLCAFP